ncbi:SIMPL domain-containing protein [Paenibacillus sp. PL91]|uniref:SIMPL domain-containing protein n=1 Tax=Paenibacillus sp. PL91 TaxID=2729538 RepID=UPI00145CD686|nr:SIMPL domain-containing protein [Paenibacillus sp. PL91]MBC9201209.1 SIMPL domain-containing protein [Paenibacillus sp. PL91]
MYGNPIYYAATPAPCKSLPTIEVLGEGTVAAAPDRALIILGAVTEGIALQPVQSENAQTVTNIIHALQDLNIPRENIQTNDYRIEIQYDFPDGQQIFKGYKVTHLLQITLDEVEQTGNVVDTAVSHGANTVSSIQFSIVQKQRFENQALSLAIQNAQLKAIAISHTLGASIAPLPSKVQELPRGTEPIPFRRALQSDSIVTPIEPGQLTIYAAVRVWYLLV